MREILFRGKRIDNGQWVDGFVTMSPCGHGAVIALHASEDENEYFSLDHACIVDPTTIGQYTGLKDKNGRRIFEGDVLQDGDKIVYFDELRLSFYVIHTYIKKDSFGDSYITPLFNEYLRTTCGEILNSPRITGNIHEQEAPK